MRRQTGVSITPNNSFLQTLPVVHSPDVRVRRDGDVIRVELPGRRAVRSGGARLRPGAANLIADAATEIRRTYPDQLVGIEGHTDTDPIAPGSYREQSRAIGGPGPGRLRLARRQRLLPARAGVRGGPRAESSRALQRHGRGQAAQPADRAGSVPQAPRPVGRRRTTGDGRRTTDDGRRTTDDGRRTTDDGRRMHVSRAPWPIALRAVCPVPSPSGRGLG